MMTRIYYIYVIIKESKEPISASDILEELDSSYNIKVNVKTIYSSIEAINEFSLLMFNKSLIKTIRARGYQCDKDIFDDGELQYMIDMVINNPNIGLDQATNMIKKIKLLSNQNQLDRMNQQDINNQKLEFNIFTTLATVNKSINNKDNMKFIYIDYKLDSHGKLTEEAKHLDRNKGVYFVSPYKLILSKSKYYLIAYDHLDKETNGGIKIFRLDRMRKVQSSKANSKNVYQDLNIDYDFGEMSRNNINMYLNNKKDTLEIIFDNSILKEVVDTFDNLNLTKVIDERYHATIDEVSINDGLLGWILMLSDKIEVVRPLSLKDDVKEKTNKIQDFYK